MSGLLVKESLKPLLRFSKTRKLWSSNAKCTFAFSAAVNHLSGPLRKQAFTSMGSKSHGLWSVIGGFDPFCVFLCFKVRCLWSQLWLTAAKNAIVKAAFELSSSRVCEKRSNSQDQSTNSRFLSSDVCQRFRGKIINYYEINSHELSDWLSIGVIHGEISQGNFVVIRFCTNDKF